MPIFLAVVVEMEVSSYARSYHDGQIKAGYEVDSGIYHLTMHGL